MLELEGYSISQLLYEDVALRVYRGTEHARHSGVILKTPHTDAPDSRQVQRLRRDYERALDLSCAGVLRPLGLVEHGRSLVLVAEDMGGELLSTLVGAPCPLDDFFPLALSLIDVIDRIHRRGVIHLDIKPQSIFLERSSNRVFLGDFGLSSGLSREHLDLKRPELIESALPYLAPEQTGLMNRSVDYRADYYALGVILYQLLTGHLPFNAHNALEWAHCHLARPPRPLRDWIPQLPRSLSALVLKLLSKQPEDRYLSVAGLRADLLVTHLCWKKGEDPLISLGRNDVSEHLQLPQKLYGRDREIHQLLKAFNRTATGGRAEWTLVSGYSGIGKSMLVAELYRPIAAQHARYLSGKFDQYKQGIPYSAVAEALRGLVQQLLTEQPAAVVQWRERILTAVGEHGQVITSLIPLAERILGPQPALPALPPDQARHRVHNALHRFLSVFARPAHPLVLFLDDLQWVDPASLSLLTHLIRQPESQCLYLIGAYRDNEVGAAHPLSLAIEDLRRQGAPLSNISLSPLTDDDVRNILADALRTSVARVTSLADLVFAKTQGNPFFCFQFITALYQDQLLRFDAENRVWIWDLEQINARNFTDNVVELMVGELLRLPNATREALELASFLGARFEADMLAHVLRTTPLECTSVLRPAQQIGLLIGQDGHYRFLHDRVQEAAYALTQPERRAGTHLRIGRLLLQSISETQLEERLFAVVGHLNHAADEITDSEERTKCAKLNLRAGLKALAATAYPAACDCLSAGARLLPTDSWRQDYALTYELSLVRAECEYLAGHFALAGALLDELLDYAANSLDRARAYLIRIKLQVTLGDNPGACETAQASLIELGVHLPLRPTKEQVRDACLEIERLMTDQPLEALIELPEITDPSMAMAVRVITSTSTAAIFTDQSLWALHDAQMILLSLHYGNSDDAVMAYLFYGFMLGAYLNRYDDGYRYTEIAWRLMEKRGAIHHRGSLIYHQALAALWVHPLSEVIRATRSSLPDLLEAGNMIIACLALRFTATYHLLRGDRLEDVERETDRCREFALEKHYPVVVSLNESTRGLVQRLRGIHANGPPEPVRVRTDESSAHFPLEESEIFGSTDRIPFVIVAEKLCEMTWHFLMGDRAAAHQNLTEAEPLMWAIPGLLPNYDYFYYGSMCLLDASADNNPEAILGRVRSNVEQLRVWAAHNPGTFSRSYLLLSAELARAEGRTLDALRLYEEALEAARAGGFVQDEALANERAADCHRNLGLSGSALAYIRAARSAYLRWGADAKVSALESAHPELLTPPPTGSHGLDATALSNIDVVAMAQAAQAISGQIVRQNLLQTLLGIALEQAGAQFGALLLVENETLSATATAAVAATGITFNIVEESAQAPPLPYGVLSYAQNSREPVVLNDHVSQRAFSVDPYIQQNAPASILCVPILRQELLVGLLYLEHRDVAQVFTRNRLVVLQHLALQAAISLENAQLYGRLAHYSRTLEDRIAQRTEDLRVTAQNLEAFSATLSHDLQAPLRHLTGYVDLLCRRLGDQIDATATGYLEVMKRSTRNMDHLITKLLHLARTNRASLKLVSVDLGELLEEVVESLRSEWASRHVEWRVGGLPTVIGDRELLRPVMTNLLSNALKYTRPREFAVIEVGRAQSDTKGVATVYVRDNGVGFNPEFVGKLFQEFQRLHDSSEFEGTGIGLASVRRIIERHGGKTWAIGVPDGGATFYFSLPDATIDHNAAQEVIA